LKNRSRLRLIVTASTLVALALVAGPLAGGPADSACDQSKQPLSHDEIIRADLTGIIALEGLDCGKVVGHSLEDHLEYHIECETGDVYRIHVSAEGHVRVNPQKN